MSNVAGRRVVDRDAHLGGGVVDASLEHRPERVGRLAVGDDLDEDAASVGAAPASGGRGWGRRSVTGGEQESDGRQAAQDRAMLHGSEPPPFG